MNSETVNALTTKCWWHRDGYPVYNNENGEALVLKTDVIAALAASAKEANAQLLPIDVAAAIDSVYPVPENPHGPAQQVAMDKRDAFRKGWEMHADLASKRASAPEHAAVQVNDDLRAEVARLRHALAFWLPNVTDKHDDVAERMLDDTFLLFDEEGNIPDDGKNAQALGWITLGDARSPGTS